MPDLTGSGSFVPPPRGTRHKIPVLTAEVGTTSGPSASQTPAVANRQNNAPQILQPANVAAPLEPSALTEVGPAVDDTDTGNEEPTRRLGDDPYDRQSVSPTLDAIH